MAEPAIPWRTLRPYIVREIEPGRAREIKPKPWLDPNQMALARQVLYNEHLRHLHNPGVNLTGMRFGRLLVLRFSGITSRRSPKRAYWCRCDCGTEKNIRGCSLTSGGTKSCGCLRQESSRENALKSLGRKYQIVRRRRA